MAVVDLYLDAVCHRKRGTEAQGEIERKDEITHQETYLSDINEKSSRSYHRRIGNPSQSSIEPTNVLRSIAAGSLDAAVIVSR